MAITIEITTTSTTEFDGDYEWIITDRYDGTFRVEVDYQGAFVDSVAAPSYTRAQVAAGIIIGKHMRGLAGRG